MTGQFVMHTVNAGYESLKIQGTVRAEAISYPRLHNVRVKCRKLRAYVRIQTVENL